MESKVITNEGAQRFSLMGIDVRVRAGAHDTGGALSAIEQIVAPGRGSPLHTTAQDKMILVLEGSVTVTIGAQEHAVSAGGTAFIARGTPHCFRNDGVAGARARILVLMTPGGHEAFLADASKAEPGTPTFGEICARHHVALVNGAAR